MTDPLEVDRCVRWRGALRSFLEDTTRYIDLEGAFRSGKTTAALHKVLASCLNHPGVHWLICRYSDDETQSKLRPVWRKILFEAGITPSWDASEHCDVLATSPPSKVYIFGLKSSDSVTRYAKLRGMTLGGVYVDQAEELPEDVFLELMGRLSQPGKPQQLLLTPNPPDESHWLARHFPIDNHLRDRQFYSVPVYVNAPNLSPESIAALEAAYPPSHPKHRPAILGQRGLNVIGRPVYGGEPEQGLIGAFVRATHVRPLTVNPMVPLCESLDYGKHHPCVVWAQFTPYGQLLVLGGLLGQDVYLEDFLPVVQQYRAQWFPGVIDVQSCSDPAGSHDSSQGLRQNGVALLREHGISVRYQPDSNAPDVRAALIERIAAYMRKRTPMGEAFGVESGPRWLLISSRETRAFPFVTDALEAGYVWDEHYVSVGSKQVRRPKKDGLYEHGMNCLEYLEHNFGGQQRSPWQIERRAEQRAQVAVRRAQRDPDESFRWDRGWGPPAHGRGGYV